MGVVDIIIIVFILVFAFKGTINGFITEAQLIEMLRMQLGIDFIDLTKVNIDPEVVNVLPKNIAKKHGIIPVRIEKDVLYLSPQIN